MAQITRLGLYGGPRAAYPGFSPAAATAAVSGTITSATEADIVSGGKTIIITLTNATWAASGAAFNAIRQDIIDGLDSSGAEATGWNTVVRDTEPVGSVVRTSDTVVTITLTAHPTYDITADETITVTVPATALVGWALDVTATPTFDITFVPAQLVIVDTHDGWRREARRKREANQRLRKQIEEIFSDEIFGKAEKPALLLPPEVAKHVIDNAPRERKRVEISTSLIEDAEAISAMMKLHAEIWRKRDEDDMHDLDALM